MLRQNPRRESRRKALDANAYAVMILLTAL
jgi:hypothetical protein